MSSNSVTKMFSNNVQLEEKAFTILANKFNGKSTGPTLNSSPHNQGQLKNQERPYKTGKNTRPTINGDLFSGEKRSNEVRGKRIDDIAMAMLEHNDWRPNKRHKRNSITMESHGKPLNPLQVREELCLLACDLATDKRCLSSPVNFVQNSQEIWDKDALPHHLVELINQRVVMFPNVYEKANYLSSGEYNSSVYTLPWLLSSLHDSGLRTTNGLFNSINQPVLIDTLDKAVNDQMETLLHVMGCSEESQRAVEWWNRKMGVENQSRSMSKTLSSRKKVQEIARMYNFTSLTTPV
jgi:hypothetical protein